MNLTTFSLRASFALLAALSACVNNAPQTNAPAVPSNTATTANAPPPAPKSPLEGIVTASVDQVTMSPGNAAQAMVRLSIADGYHVNANPAAEKFLIPTTLEVMPEAGITVDNIVYPKSHTKKFSFAEKPLSVYEGDAVINLSLRAARAAARGAHALRAKIRVQPCDDEKCYPPATIETSIPLTIN